MSLLEHFDLLMIDCGILNFGIPYGIPSIHHDCKEFTRDCNNCIRNFVYQEKQNQERTAFIHKSDRNKAFYINRYEEFRETWIKLVEKCHNLKYYDNHLPYFFTEGYEGMADDDEDDDDNFEFIRGELNVNRTPFQCRKLFMKNAIDYLRGVINEIKDDIRDLKN